MCGVSECAINTLCLGVSLYKPNGYQTMKSLFVRLFYITNHICNIYAENGYPVKRMYIYIYLYMLRSDYPVRPYNIYIESHKNKGGTLSPLGGGK